MLIRVRWVDSGAPSGVVGFIPVHSVYSGAPWGSSYSLGIVEFIRARPWGGRVHSDSFERALGSLGSFSCALVSLGSFGHAQGLLGSFAFVALIQAHPRCHRINFDSLGSFERVQGVVGCDLCFIFFRFVNFCDKWVLSGSLWLIRARPGSHWVHSGARTGSLGSLGTSLWIVGFIVARSGGRWFHSCSLGTLGHSLGAARLIRGRPGVAAFIWAGRWFHLGFLFFFGCALGVVRVFGHVLLGPRFHSSSLGSFGRGPPVIGFHSGASWGSLGSFGRALEVDGFILARPVGRRVYSGSLWGRGVFWFILARPVGPRIHSGALWGSLVSFRFVRVILACRCQFHLGVLVLLGSGLGFNSGAHFESSCSFEFVGFIWTWLLGSRPGCRWVLQASPRGVTFHLGTRLW